LCREFAQPALQAKISALDCNTISGMIEVQFSMKISLTNQLSMLFKSFMECAQHENE